MENIAILYQCEPPPQKEGAQKPMKLGGYSDSGADIGFCLQENGYNLITPADHPDPFNDYDWVFPDSTEGIEKALYKGANVFWLNTVLFKNHAIESYFDTNIELVGQIPAVVDQYDDKTLTNQLLKENNLPIPKSLIIEKEQFDDKLKTIFPTVVKPIRGRGSQGVSVVNNQTELTIAINDLFGNDIYGNKIYTEQFLPGQEITITVMPPGEYEFDYKKHSIIDYWSLPPVKRFNHENGIAPYSGVVAVMNNSQVLSEKEMENDEIKLIENQCQEAAKLVNAKAPIRIDCRADDTGKYYIFDLNMKPNMTGPSRSHRQNQDSLTMIAARKIGWTYFDLLKNILKQRWKPTSNMLE